LPAAAWPRWRPRWERVDITLIAPETKFFNRAMAVDQLSRIRSRNGLKLREVAGERGAFWARVDGALELRQAVLNVDRCGATVGSSVNEDALAPRRKACQPW
jgi:hypothetical protein